MNTATYQCQKLALSTERINTKFLLLNFQEFCKSLNLRAILRGPELAADVTSGDDGGIHYPPPWKAKLQRQKWHCLLILNLSFLSTPLMEYRIGKYRLHFLGSSKIRKSCVTKFWPIGYEQNMCKICVILFFIFIFLSVGDQMSNILKGSCFLLFQECSFEVTKLQLLEKVQYPGNSWVNRRNLEPWMTWEAYPCRLPPYLWTAMDKRKTSILFALYLEILSSSLAYTLINVRTFKHFNIMILISHLNKLNKF